MLCIAIVSGKIMSTADGAAVVDSERSEEKRWASLADRLNPNRAAFDPKLKAEWSTMDKAKRKRVIAEDKRNIQEFKSRAAKNGPLPFSADPDDHCETSPSAYTHIAPLLRLIAKCLGKSPNALDIYDPYFCKSPWKSPSMNGIRASHALLKRCGKYSETPRSARL